MKSIVFNERDYDLPYEAQPERNVFAFVDLRLHPELVETIPELKQVPPLKFQVLAFNQPNGPFMTHGCAVAGKPPGAEHSPIPVPEPSKNAPFWCTTCVLFSFWLLDDNTASRYQEMFDSYSFDREDQSVCFEVQKTYFWKPEEIRAGFRDNRAEWHACLLWTSGWGGSKAQAIRGWERCNQDVIEFVKAYGTPDSPGGVTVSHRLSRPL